MGSVGARKRSGSDSESVDVTVATADSRATEEITGQVLTRDDIPELQREMGQTGDEAGEVNPIRRRDKIYVNTSKSFNINAYLNSDGESISSPHSDWDTVMGYDRSAIRRDIERIDRGMKPLPENISLTRFVDVDAIQRMIPGIGIDKSNIQSVLNTLESDSSAASNFATVLRNVDYTHKAYTSASYLQTHPSYGSRDIKMNIVMRKGTNAIVTNNHRESEILGAHGLKYNFTGGFRVATVTDEYGRQKKQLVLDVYI